MSDFVEWNPKRHGQRPPYWTPDTLTGLDNKNYVRQPNWAWIAGTTYYVPYEAVHGVPRLAPVDADADADADAAPVDDLVKRMREAELDGYGYLVALLDEAADRIEAQANTIEELRSANERWVSAFNQAAAEERAKIVAWLRGFATNYADDLADILEAGEHEDFTHLRDT